MLPKTPSMAQSNPFLTDGDVLGAHDAERTDRSFVDGEVSGEGSRTLTAHHNHVEIGACAFGMHPLSVFETRSHAHS